ncbi:MAG: TetR/AcrR family transcriptional regulator, partial [Stutzerimonas stutzeri]
MATMAEGKTARGRRKRVSPGRPEGPSFVREHILDAAEAKFADYGFAGTSLRDICDQTNVTQALVNYYFGSKNGLFVEVYMRRGRVVSEQRMANLAAVTADTGAGVADILRAYLSPAFDMRTSEGGRAFIRLQARLHTEPMEFAYEIRRQTYDESTRAYAELLASRLPALSTGTIYWRLIQTVGAYLYIISDAHRIAEISAGAATGTNDEETLNQLVAFAAGGFAAPDL